MFKIGQHVTTCINDDNIDVDGLDAIVISGPIDDGGPCYIIEFQEDTHNEVIEEAADLPARQIWVSENEIVAL